MSTPLRPAVAALMLGALALCAGAASAQGVGTRGPERIAQIAAALTGQIVGTVIDEAGLPLDGAVVSALGGTTAFAVSDKTGQFVLRQLPPGPYMLRAHREGYFAARSAIVNVRPSTQSASTFTMRREGTLGAPRVTEAGVGAVAGAAPVQTADDRGGDESEVAWRVRRLKRGVLRDATAVAGRPAEDDDWFLVDSFERIGRVVGTSARAATALFSDLAIGGQVNLLTTGAFDNPLQLLQLERTSGVTFFSLGAPVGSHGEWAVRAAMNQSDLSSWMLTGSYAVRAEVPHRFQVGMSYSLQRYEGGNALALAAVPDAARNVGSVFASDEWAVSRYLSLGYGATYAHYDYLEGPALFSPHLSATVSATPKLRVRVSAQRLLSAPGGQEFLPPTRAEYLPPQRTFSTVSRHDAFQTQDLQHYAVGVERTLSGATVGARVFRERVDNQMVTVFGLRQPDAGASALGHYRVGSAGDADLTGIGLTLTHALVQHVRGSVDYSVTTASWSEQAPRGDAAVFARWIPAAVRPTRERVHDLTTSLQTEIPQTATRVAVIYKLNSAFIAGDGTGAEPGVDARFDVQVNQALPFLNFRASQWEMLVAVRSLFHDGAAVTSTFDELLVVRPPKRLIGGLSVRF